jgi:hypothetical protein
MLISLHDEIIRVALEQIIIGVTRDGNDDIRTHR